MNESGTSGLTLAIVQKDRIIHAKGYGLADAATNKNVSTKTLFRIGSLSKVFTASALMQLQEANRLDIDRPLVEYLPDFSIKTGPMGGDSSYKDITLRNMLTHRSGLPSDYHHNNYSRNSPSLEEYTAQFKNEYSAYAPGYISSYSNSAVTILGRVIEVVSGVSFDEYLENQLLSPSGMNLSSFRLREDMREELSKAYRGGAEVPHGILAESPAGNLYSNAEDMSNFIRMILNKGRFSGQTVLKSSTLKKMFRLQNPDDPFVQATNTKMGLAWFIREDYAGKTLGHNGAVGTFHSQLYITPEQNMGIFVSVNTAESQGTMGEIAEFVRELSLELMRDLKKPTPPANTHVPVPWPEANLEKYPGIYSLPGLGVSKIIRQDQNLQFQVKGQTYDLALMSNGKVLLQLGGQTLPGVSLGFRTIDEKDLLILNPDQGGSIGLRFTKTKIPTVWTARQGLYFNKNPGEDVIAAVQLSVEDGLLIARVGTSDVQREFILIPVDEKRAYIHGLGRNAGETIGVDETGALHVTGNIMIKTP